MQLKLVTYLETLHKIFEVQSAVIKDEISDHFGISCVFRATLETKIINECIVQEDISQSNVKRFKEPMIGTTHIIFLLISF